MDTALVMSIESADLAQLGRVLRVMKDGKELRRDLARNLRTASEPARDAARRSIMEMDSAGLEHDEGEPLRVAIADRIVTEARLSGRSTGARVKAKKLTDSTRGFRLAPKRTNAPHWRRPVWGRRDRPWTVQVGKPRWFDDAMHANVREWRQAVRAAMEETRRRIIDRLRNAGGV